MFQYDAEYDADDEEDPHELTSLASDEDVTSDLITTDESTDDESDGYSPDPDSIGFTDQYTSGDGSTDMDTADYTYTTGCEFDDDSIESCSSIQTFTPLAYY